MNPSEHELNGPPETPLAESPEEQPSLPPRRTLVARAVRWIAVCSLLLLLFFLVTPMLLSRRWVYQPLVDRFARIDHKLRIDAISAGWFSPLIARGISVQQPNGEVLLRIAEVKSSLSLLDLLATDGDFQTIVIERPEVHVRLLNDGNNVQQLVDAIDGRSPHRDRSKGPPAVNVTLDVRDLLIRVDDADQETRLLETNPARFQVHYLAAEDMRRIEIPPTRIVDHLQLTPQLLAVGLELALPAFYQATAVDGEISIDVQHCVIPLDQPLDSEIRGTIWLHEVAASARAPMLQKAIQFAGVVTGRQIEQRLVIAAESEVPFAMSDRRVYHEGLRFGLPRIDERLQFATEGWVDLERQTEMTLFAPVPVEMLARREPIKAMGVPVISLRITGSLDAPQVDLPATGRQVLELAAEIFRRRSADAEEVGDLDGGARDARDQAAVGELSPSAELATEGAKIIGGLLEQAWERRTRGRAEAELRDEAEPRDEEETTGRRGLFRRMLRRPQSNEDDVDTVQ